MLGAGSCRGSQWCAQVVHDPALQALAGIGVCLLLFEVGLQSTVADRHDDRGAAGSSVGGFTPPDGILGDVP